MLEEPPPPAPGPGWETCECGALKTFGAGPLVPGHSSWCHWSVYQLKPGEMGALPWFCELRGCMNQSRICALSNGKEAPVLGVLGTVHWYCNQCWGKFILPRNFSQYWVVSRP
jgi:hypothetical protein